MDQIYWDAQYQMNEKRKKPTYKQEQLYHEHLTGREGAEEKDEKEYMS